MPVPSERNPPHCLVEYNCSISIIIPNQVICSSWLVPISLLNNLQQQIEGKAIVGSKVVSEKHFEIVAIF